MNTADLLAEAYGRLPETVHGALAGLDVDELSAQLDPDTNSVGWLVWHLTRVQDDHIADVAGTKQQWTSSGWHERFDLPYPPADHGYGHTAADVAAFRVTDPALLTGYFDAVYAATTDYLRGISDSDLDRVVDEGWDPPVTLAARLVSVLDDDLRHAGQAEFLRGVLLRRRSRQA